MEVCWLSDPAIWVKTHGLAGEFTTQNGSRFYRRTLHFSGYYSGWIKRMFTAGRIWSLTHGHFLTGLLFSTPGATSGRAAGDYSVHLQRAPAARICSAQGGSRSPFWMSTMIHFFHLLSEYVLFPPNSFQGKLSLLKYIFQGLKQMENVYH